MIGIRGSSNQNRNYNTVIAVERISVLPWLTIRLELWTPAFLTLNERQWLLNGHRRKRRRHIRHTEVMTRNNLTVVAIIVGRWRHRNLMIYGRHCMMQMMNVVDGQTERVHFGHLAFLARQRYAILEVSERFVDCFHARSLANVRRRSLILTLHRALRFRSWLGRFAATAAATFLCFCLCCVTLPDTRLVHEAAVSCSWARARSVLRPMLWWLIKAFRVVLIERYQSISSGTCPAVQTIQAIRIVISWRIFASHRKISLHYKTVVMTSRQRIMCEPDAPTSIGLFCKLISVSLRHRKWNTEDTL